jgi:hypothetical protein
LLGEPSRQSLSLLTRRAEEASPLWISDARFERKFKKEVQQEMNGFRKTVAAATIAGSMLAGGVVGAALYGVSAVTAAAATATPSPTTPTATAADPNAPFVSNETAAHEATESAAREAQENAGIRPTVP